MTPGIKKIRPAFIIYWVLLAYIIAALVWWFIALNRQSTKLSEAKRLELRKDDPAYNIYSIQIEDERKRKAAQYIGEGVTFLLLIIAGAVFVFRAVRRELRLGAAQRDFMIAVAHELKTPIAVAKLNLETLLKRKLDDAQQQRLLGNTLQEAERLNSLSSNMLLSSQMEAKAYKMSQEELNYSELVEGLADAFKSRYAPGKIVTEIQNDLFVNGDHFLLSIALNNIFENAVKYSPKELPVEIIMYQENSHAIVETRDHGAGIDEGERRKVFEKFYRTGNEATRKAKGTGLGLYLTSRIAAAHDGNITIRDNPKGGTIFVLSLQANA